MVDIRAGGTEPSAADREVLLGGDGMPSFSSLTDQEIAGVVGYLATWSERCRPGAASSSTTRVPPDLASHHGAASTLVVATRDIVDERSIGLAPPRWCVDRGWADRLAALTDDELDRVERDGLARVAASLDQLPPDLMALAAAVGDVVALPEMGWAPADDVEPRRAGPRKRAQVAAFERLARPLSTGATRIVDVGCGHGHLTRHLARSLGVTTEGWERDEERVTVARSLADGASAPRYRSVDVRDTGDEIEATDLVVGLHACGELGDRAVMAAARVGSALALVGCCLQKRAGDRAPLAPRSETEATGLTLGRGVLGLANARDGEEGIEETLETRVRSRVTRLALRTLLAQSGVTAGPGEEMRGINRRRAEGSLDELARQAFSARGLPFPSHARLREAEASAQRESALTRRWETPRTMLARLLEVWVALDRAMLLARNGGDPRVVVAFPRAESPRNIAVLCPRRGG